MFVQGQKIIYGNHGVCEIEDIILRKDPLLGEKQTYLILLSNGLTAYVPVDSTVFMRELMTKEEAEEVIRSFPSIGTQEFTGSNSKALADRYRAILGRHVPEELFCLYKSLKAKVLSAVQNGKKPGAMDDRFSALAISLVTDELSVVLECPRTEILAKLGVDEDEASLRRAYL